MLIIFVRPLATPWRLTIPWGHSCFKANGKSTEQKIRPPSDTQGPPGDPQEQTTKNVEQEIPSNKNYRFVVIVILSVLYFVLLL